MVIRSGDFHVATGNPQCSRPRLKYSHVSMWGAPDQRSTVLPQLWGFPTMGEAQNGKTNGLGLGPVLFLRGDCERCQLVSVLSA